MPTMPSTTTSKASTLAAACRPARRPHAGPRARPRARCWTATTPRRGRHGGRAPRRRTGRRRRCRPTRPGGGPGVRSRRRAGRARRSRGRTPRAASASPRGRSPSARPRPPGPPRPCGRGAPQSSRTTTAEAMPPSWVSERCTERDAQEPRPRRGPCRAALKRWPSGVLGDRPRRRARTSPAGRRAPWRAPPWQRSGPPASVYRPVPARPATNRLLHAVRAYDRQRLVEPGDLAHVDPDADHGHRALLDGHGLGEVARLVDVVAHARWRARRRRAAAARIATRGCSSTGTLGSRISVVGVRLDRGRRLPRP